MRRGRTLRLNRLGQDNMGEERHLKGDMAGPSEGFNCGGGQLETTRDIEGNEALEVGHKRGHLGVLKGGVGNGELTG